MNAYPNAQLLHIVDALRQRVELFAMELGDLVCALSARLTATGDIADIPPMSELFPPQEEDELTRDAFPAAGAGGGAGGAAGAGAGAAQGRAPGAPKKARCIKRFPVLPLEDDEEI